MGSNIVSVLEAADRLVQGDGDDCDWMHGFRLTATTDDASYSGPATRGNAERDLNVDLILALASAKSKDGGYSTGKTGVELFDAIKDNVDWLEGGLDTPTTRPTTTSSTIGVSMLR